jgi:YgiT-type zinc finger domain-containing protein
MDCLICRQAKLIDGLTSILFERGELKLMVKQVPARICPSCGDAYVAEDVAVRLLRGAEEISTAGTMEDVRQYESL